MIERGSSPSFTLSVVHGDALATRVRPGKDDDVPDLRSDVRYGIEDLSPRKRAAWESIRSGGFDVVVGNPPYVAEANNKVLFDRLRALPAWPKADVPGKSDYAYFFLALAIEKLAVGGRLAVITPAGWLNAGGAEWLRRAFLDTMRIDEAFLFGGMRLFTPEHEDLRVAQRHGPPTVESLILTATKIAGPEDVPDGHTVRIVVVEDEAAALRGLPSGAGTRQMLKRLAARADRPAARRDGVLVHDLPHDLLEAETPWPLKFSTRSVQVRVVRHMDAALAVRGRGVERLDARWKLFRGIETGADAYSGRVRKRLTRSARQALDAAGVVDGDPVLEVPLARAAEAPWSDHPEVLARSHEATAIHYGAVDASQETRLLWLGPGDDAPPAVLEELAVWRPVLEGRAAIARTQEDARPRRWWETAWPRDPAEMTAPKVIALYRTDRGRFAVDEDGSWHPSTKSTLAVSRSGTDSVAYLCGVLNSELLDVWYGIRGKVPRDVWRNYEPKPMARMPYRHVEMIDGWAPGDDVLVVQQAVALDGTVSDALALAEVVGATGRRLRGAAALDAHAMVEHLVRAMVGNRSRLLELRPLADGLSQAVRDPWRIHGVSIRRGAVLGALENGWLSVRVDPAVTATVHGDGAIGKPVLEETDGETRLVFRRARKITATVSGDVDRLRLVLDAALFAPPRTGAEVLALRVPADPAAFERHVTATGDEIQRLLVDGRRIVEAIERLVCRLYDVPEPLEAAVLAHADVRARTRGATAVEDDGDKQGEG